MRGRVYIHRLDHIYIIIYILVNNDQDVPYVQCRRVLLLINYWAIIDWQGVYKVKKKVNNKYLLYLKHTLVHKQMYRCGVYTQ
jgi:hypothetical protein